MKIHIFNILWNLFFMVWSAYHMVGHIMNNRQNMATLQACAMVFFGAFLVKAIDDMIKHLVARD